MSPRAAAAVAAADLRERLRGDAFRLTLAAALALAWLAVPPAGAGYLPIDLGDHRGVYDSHWIGGTVALVAGLLLSLAGFYLGRGGVARDRRLGVGEVLAATPLTRLGYAAGRVAGNAALLALAAAATLAGAAAMQWLRGEAPVEPAALAAPFALLVLPAVLLTAALAVLFDCTPGLRGAGGNVLWFAAWVWAVGAGPWRAVLGRYQESITAALARAHPEAAPRFGIFGEAGPDLRLFPWPGLDWGAADGLRLAACAAAAALAIGLAALLFDRFDPGRGRRRAKAARAGAPAAEPAAAPARREGFGLAAAAPIAAQAPLEGAPLLPLVGAELRMLLRGHRLWWYAGALLWIVLAWALPSEAARARALGLAWLWPLAAFSALGARESVHRTAPLIAAAPRPLTRPLLAAWIAGGAAAVVFAGGAGLRPLLAGGVAAAAGWIAGALFVPALALAAGTWSGGPKLFEALYAALWYLAAVERVPALDFLGAASPAAAAGTAAAAAAFLALAAAGRRRRLARS